MPPVAVPSAARVAERWSRRAAAASQDYADGASSTTRSWQAATQASAANWQAGVTAAAGRGAFAKGVSAAGDARWKRGVMEKGPARYAQGVQVASGDFSAAIAPVLEVIARTDIPPRGPRGSASNYNRVSAIGNALSKLRTG